jgi:hypothetical protein
MRRRIAAWFLAAIWQVLIGMSPTLAAQNDDDDKLERGTSRASPSGKTGEKREKGERAEKGEKERVETEDLFGFMEGSDTGEAGERGVTIEALWRRRTLFSPYSALLGKLSFEYSLRDNLKIGAGISYDLYHFPPLNDSRTQG